MLQDLTPPSFLASRIDDANNDVACGTRRCWKYSAVLTTTVGFIMLVTSVGFGGCSCAGQSVCEAKTYNGGGGACSSWFGGCQSGGYSEKGCVNSVPTTLRPVSVLVLDVVVVEPITLLPEISRHSTVPVLTAVFVLGTEGADPNIGNACTLQIHANMVG